MNTASGSNLLALRPGKVEPGKSMTDVRGGGQIAAIVARRCQRRGESPLIRHARPGSPLYMPLSVRVVHHALGPTRVNPRAPRREGVFIPPVLRNSKAIPIPPVPGLLGENQVRCRLSVNMRCSFLTFFVQRGQAALSQFDPLIP
jgi:hypothetical protein